MIFQRHPARRQSLLAGLMFVAAIAWALPAFAAEVVAVRAGSHPKFTRVVFELDGSAGYSIEKVGTAKAPMLRVTVEAGSRFHRLHTTGDIKDVKVTAGTRAVATLALSRSDLRVQEMILSSPHRIVLDLYRPESAYAKAPAPEKPAAAKTPAPAPVAKTPPTPKPAPVAKTPAPTPAPIAKTEPAPTPIAKTEPAPVAPKPAPKPIAKAESEAKAEPAPEPVRTIAKPLVPRPDPEPAVVEPKPGSVAETTPSIEPKPAISPKPADAPAALRPTKIAERPKPSLDPVKPQPAKPGPSETAPAAASPGWMERLTGDPIVQAAVAVGMLVLVGLVFLAVRSRRALPNDLDVTAIAEEVESAGSLPAGGFSMDDAFASSRSKVADDESSFDGLFDQDDAPPRHAAEKTAFSAPDPAPAPVVAQTPEPSEPDSLFGDTDSIVGESASEGDDPMNQDMDLPVDSAMGPPPAMGGAAAPSNDVMQMIQGFERRMQALEAKLDEANEAREKLERQVAAQSEELRVQRAAIARTQRALRTMSRADEDKATEPALRDGDTQAKTRVNV